MQQDTAYSSVVVNDHIMYPCPYIVFAIGMDGATYDHSLQLHYRQYIYYIFADLPSVPTSPSLLLSPQLLEWIQLTMSRLHDLTPENTSRTLRRDWRSSGSMPQPPILASQMRRPSSRHTSSCSPSFSSSSLSLFSRPSFV